MPPEVRVQIPGGALSVQDLRDLVGWAGSAQARFVRLGDAQDLVLEATGTPPARFRVTTGSVQSSAYGELPPGLPWLSAGVWMDLVTALPDPGELSVQVLHDPVSAQFVRHAHLRFTARKAAHQWDLFLRRPGSDRRLHAGTVATGELPEAVARAVASWAARDDHFWRGDEAAPLAQTFFAPEGFHRETTTFSFAWAPPQGRFPVDRLRDLTWLAAETGASRAWITPLRSLVFDGVPQSRRREWGEWLTRHRLPETHGQLDRAITAAGWSPDAQAASREVLTLLRDQDRMPPSGRLLVAVEELNRGDGVCAVPAPVLIRTGGGWLYRSGDGRRSGEGTLEQVLDALEAPATPPTPTTVGETRAGHRCDSCLTVYDAAYGDPQGGVGVGTAFEALPPSWVCPVCSGPRSAYRSWSAMRTDATIVS